MWNVYNIPVILLTNSMPVSGGKTHIQIGPELKKELMYYKAKYNARSYEEVIVILLKEKGLWKEQI